MNEIKWIKLSTTIFDDEKIKLIESMPDKDAILIIWIKLLAQAGKCNANGYLLLNNKIPYTDEMLSTLFNRSVNTIRLALETFKNFGMIELENKTFKISEWADTQNIEGMEKIREQNRIRKQRQRQLQKDFQKELLLEQKTNKNIKNYSLSRDKSRDCHKSHVTVTPLDIDIDKDIDKDINNKSTYIAKKNVKKKIIKEKNNYSEFVSLTKEQYKILCDKYSEPATKRMIEILNNYKGSNNKTYKSDYHAILNWVVDKFEKEVNVTKSQEVTKCNTEKRKKEGEWKGYEGIDYGF